MIDCYYETMVTSISTIDIAKLNRLFYLSSKLQWPYLLAFNLSANFPVNIIIYLPGIR